MFHDIFHLMSKKDFSFGNCRAKFFDNILIDVFIVGIKIDSYVIIEYENLSR